MSQIAIRRAGEDGWSTVEAGRYPDEDYLQTLLYESPDLVPFEEIRHSVPDALVSLREFGFRTAGASDLVFVDSDGALTIIECKLATNPDARRTVLAQVLDYGSALAGMSYADFNSRASRTLHGRDLAEAMAEKVTSEDFDIAAFRDSVSDTLAKGEAELVIAIDRMNPDLKRLLDYVEKRSDGRLKVFALEIQYHRTDGLEALVPQIANPGILVGNGHPSGRSNVTVEGFRTRLERVEDERTQRGALQLLAFCERHAEWLARGKTAIGMVVDCGGKRRSLLTLEDDGEFWINAGNTRVVVGDKPVDRLLQSLETLPGFGNIRTTRDQKWTKIQPNPELGDPKIFAAFERAVGEYQDSVRGE